MHITIQQNLLAANAEKANEIRALLKQRRVLLINLISSPGSGKTTILEQTIPELTKNFRVAVIEGDVETDRDAKRLTKLNIPVSLINTNGACHLESISIEKALQNFDLTNLDIIFVENVGNLVCPAEFDIGENAKIAVLSIPEGDDKPIKYPLLFREASLLLLNKIDLIPYSDFNMDNFKNDVKKLQADLPIIELSATKQLGMKIWLNWLQTTINNKKY